MDNTVNLSGINIDITKVLGDALVEKFLANISDEELDLIVNEAKSEIWTKDYNNETVIKKEVNNSGYYRKLDDTTIVKYAKNELNERMKTIITDKISEYVNSDEYKEKAEAVFKEIINYALEGYKNDMIIILRKRLAIDPFTDSYENIVSNIKDSAIEGRLSGLEAAFKDMMNRYN